MRAVEMQLAMQSIPKARMLLLREFWRRETKTHKKKCLGGGAHGGCFHNLEICEIRFAQSGNMTYDVDLLGPACDFLRCFTTSFELFERSTCSATFR